MHRDPRFQQQHANGAVPGGGGGGGQMLGKLFALVDERCCADNPDAATSHEVLLAGHLLMRFMREKLWECLEAVREGVRRDAARAPQAIALQARPPHRALVLPTPLPPPPSPCPRPPRAARPPPAAL